ncbi:hypothetical protein DNI29_19025 [Hymenobacter sediminis]|uniref:hypothetical protein n=1 Tax=Hymenobacter sediminis TaxID=2218621 RepID=UPI000DA678FF|nr:hypothetical protein [Hymenobacter sediminis]RPD45475.1 hypothetical protein DNI29_19025 [Hymenobacter sediminis]
MLSEALATARTEYYQANARLTGAQQLYDQLLSQNALSGDAFQQASLVLSTLRQEKKGAWNIYMRAVQQENEAHLQRVTEAQQASYGVSMVISPPAEYALA